VTAIVTGCDQKGKGRSERVAQVVGWSSGWTYSWRSPEFCGEVRELSPGKCEVQVKFMEVDM
jgi:hypothetical protein